MKRFFALLVSIYVSLTLLPHAWAQSGELIKPNPSSITTAADLTDKVAKMPSAADDQRTSKILNDLAKQSGWFPEMKISVSSGVVNLEGHTKSAEQLQWLAKTADRLPTVIAVINKAQVDQPAVTDLTPAWNELMRLLNKAKRSLPLFLIAAVMIAAAWFLSRSVYKGVESLWGRRINNPFLLSTVSKISMIPIWLLLFYLVLQTAGLSSLATTVIGGTGALGLVLGFAFKDIAENYLSGLLLAIRSPFTKGDDVNVAGYDGFVQALNMRGTTILAYDGTLILVPNSIVIKSVIRNRTTNPRQRLVFTIMIGLGDSPGKAIELIYKSIEGEGAVLKDPAPNVFASDITTSGVNIQARFWVDAKKSNTDRTKSAVMSAAKEQLMAAGISIPDTAREVILTEAHRLSGEISSRHVDESNVDHRETGVNQDDQIKRLGEGVDIMDSNADRHLIKSASL